MPTIMFNGKTYNSVDEMPTNEREAFGHISQVFVDKNGNGIPDFLEGDAAKNVMTAFSSSISMDGKVYNNINELPPEIRAKVQGAFDKLSQMGIAGAGAPVVVSAMQMSSGPMQMESSPMALSTPPAPLTNSSAIRDDKGPGTMFWIGIAALAAVCLAVAVALGTYLYLKGG